MSKSDRRSSATNTKTSNASAPSSGHTHTSDRGWNEITQTSNTDHIITKFLAESKNESMGRLQRLRLFQVYPETENFEIAPDSRLGPNETRLNDRLAIRTITPGKLIFVLEAEGGGYENVAEGTLTPHMLPGFLECEKRVLAHFSNNQEEHDNIKKLFENARNRLKLRNNGASLRRQLR